MDAFFNSLDSDIIVFQETKVGTSLKDLEESLLHVKGFESYWSLCKKRPGYSGVVTYVKQGLTIEAKNEFGREEFDREGRVMMTDHGSFVLFNVYFPNSGSDDLRLSYKIEFYQWFESICDQYISKGREVIVAGDVNTTHTQLDIWCPEKLSKGLFEQERRWMDHIFDRSLAFVHQDSQNGSSTPATNSTEDSNNGQPTNFVDAFRALHPTWKKYSWWDVKQNMRIVDQGYRLDYFLVTKSFMNQVVECDMLTQQLGSDHCPIFLVLQPQIPPSVSKIPQLSSERLKRQQTRIGQFFSVVSKKTVELNTATTSIQASSSDSTLKETVLSNNDTNTLALAPEVDDEVIPARSKRNRSPEDSGMELEAKRPKLTETSKNLTQT